MKMKECISITLFGTSGSGKTTFLSGINESLIGGCAVGKGGAIASMTGSPYDARFGGDNPNSKMNGINTSVIMADYIQKRLIANQGKDGKFSASAGGTVEMSQFIFDFDVTTSKGQELTVPVKLTDYRGGILSLKGKNITQNDIAEANALVDNATNSEVIAILIDGIKLAQYKDNASLRKEKTGADRINTLMNAIMKNPSRGTTVVILVTKVDSDQISASLKANGYQELCNLACSTLDSVFHKSAHMASSYDWNFAVVPVTAIGENNSVTKYIPDIDEYYCAIKANADVHQENIDTALIYGIKSALSGRVRTLTDEIRKCDARIDSEASKISVFDIKHRKAAIAETTKVKNENAAVMSRYSSLYEALNEGFADKFMAVKRFGLVKRGA